jgi:hypothetical protein
MVIPHVNFDDQDGGLWNIDLQLNIITTDYPKKISVRSLDIKAYTHNTIFITIVPLLNPLLFCAIHKNIT